MAGRPRKTARRIVNAPPTVEAPPVAGAVPIPTPDSLPGSSLGLGVRERHSYKAEAEQLRQQLAARDAQKLDPRDFVPVTAGLLQVMAAAIKGDDATPDELDRCNGALVAVANKYGATFRYWDEVILFLALGSTGVAMRQRAAEKRRDNAEASQGNASRRPSSDFGDSVAAIIAAGQKGAES